jgi:NAD+ kinase
MKIAINTRPLLEEHAQFVLALYQSLQARGVVLHLHVNFLHWLVKKKQNIDNVIVFEGNHDLASDLDFVFSIGGDGTLLETVTFVGKREIPIVGINAGRLGFLATVQTNEIAKALDHIFAGKFRVEKRSLLKLVSDKDLFGGLNFAVNEFAILKKDTSSMIVVHAYLDGEFLNSYWSDGLIVSTPTGSTGYSLSCGGPIVLPESNNFIIAPISPHNLNVRPLIIPDSCELSFKIEDRKKKFLVALDSRSIPVNPSIELKVKKEEFNLMLVSFEGSDFISTLRKKLNWGLDVRN